MIALAFILGSGFLTAVVAGLTFIGMLLHKKYGVAAAYVIGLILWIASFMFIMIGIGILNSDQPQQLEVQGYQTLIGIAVLIPGIAAGVGGMLLGFKAARKAVGQKSDT
jgi:hypothetical protein